MKHITIGRQYGSGGRAIGKKIAEKLNIAYYDTELIHLASHKSGMSKEYIESLDEKGTASLFNSLMMNSIPFTNVMPYTPIYTMPMYYSTITNDQLFRLQSEIILELALKGSAIFVGRCADYVLRDKDILSIFIHAPKNVREENIVKVYQCDKNEAVHRIKTIDKKRKEYYNYYTSKEWSAVDSYHLSIDSSKFSDDEIVDLIAKAYKAK